MNKVGSIEHITQYRMIKLFQDELAIKPASYTKSKEDCYKI